MFDQFTWVLCGPHLPVLALPRLESRPGLHRSLTAGKHLRLSAYSILLDMYFFSAVQDSLVHDNPSVFFDLDSKAVHLADIEVYRLKHDS